MWPHWCWVEGDKNFPQPAGHFWSSALRALPYLQWVHCWRVINLAFTKIPRSLQQEYDSVGCFPACIDVLLPPRAGLSTCPCQTSWGFCRPGPQGYWDASCYQPLKQVQVSFTDLLRVHAGSSSKSLLKMLNSRRTVVSQILDSCLLMTTEVWCEWCSWLPAAGVKSRLPFCSCSLSCKLRTSSTKVGKL